MIVPSMKYNISEVSLNDYHFVSTLHIKSLNKNDFAQYVCVAKNTIGKSEEMIKIYGNFCISFALKTSAVMLYPNSNTAARKSFSFPLVFYCFASTLESGIDVAP